MGPSVFVRQPDNAADNTGLICRQVRTKLGLSRSVFARVVSLSERTIAALESGKAASDTTRRRVQEVARLYEGLARAVDASEIGPWLLEPNDAFEGLKPIEVIERGQSDRLWRLVYVLESGVPG